MAFDPINNERLSDKVVRILMEKIKSGQLKPGDKLPNEHELAEMLQVSRGILREALTILQSHDYLIRKPKEGTMINPNLNPQSLDDRMGAAIRRATYIDLLETRICIEQKVVEKVIAKATNAEIDELYSLISQNQNHKNTQQMDYFFHYRLAELSKNTIFINFTEIYYEMIREIKNVSVKNKERGAKMNQEHLAIMKAIEARDVTMAQSAVVHHLNMLTQQIDEAELPF